MNDKNIFDIAVIGGGISGTGIAYELSKFQVSTVLIEKSTQVTQSTSKGNSGIIHAGYDDPKGSLRAKLVTIGNKRYDDWSRELGVGLKRPGSIVVAFDDNGVNYLKTLKKKGDNRSVPVEIIDQKTLLEAEPNLNPEAIGALYAPSTGIICPMRFVNFLFKNSLINGVTPAMNSEVLDFSISGDKIQSISTTSGTIHAELVINAAGLFGDAVSEMAGIANYEIHPRKGEYILLEPHPNYNVNHVVFPIPTKDSKGALVIPTETGDVLLGPTSQDMDKKSKEDLTTTMEGLRTVLEKTRQLIPGVHTGLTVKTFAGNRAQPDTNDFIIERYLHPSNFINVIGIRSPGLTSAPAIADMVIGLVQEIIGSLEKKKTHKRDVFVSHNQSKEAMVDIEWANTLTPNLDSPSLPLLEGAWNFGVQKELYNYSCFSDTGLGVDLGTTFQNELIQFILKKGLPCNDILYRLHDSQQVLSGK